AEWIDVPSTYLKLIMEVRPGGQTSHADIADDLALGNVTAGSDAIGVTTHVRIQRLVGLTMLYDHRIAISTFTSDMDHAAVTGCLDRCACGGSIVHAIMCADLVQY